MSKYSPIQSKLVKSDGGYIPFEMQHLFVIIPDVIMYDSKLTGDAKLLLGEIYLLAYKYGYCFATNNFFAIKHRVNAATVSRWITQLSKLSYISTESKFTLNTDGSKVKNRRIFILDKTKLAYDNIKHLAKMQAPLAELQEGIDKNASTSCKNASTSCKNASTSCKNVSYNSISNSTPNRKNKKIDRSDDSFSASPLAKDIKIETLDKDKIDSDPIKIDIGCYSKPKIDIPASPSSPTDADTPAQPVLQAAEYDGRGYPLLHTFVSFGVSQGYPVWLCEWVHMDMSSKGFKLNGNPITNWKYMLGVYADKKLERRVTEDDYIALKYRLSDKDSKKGKKASQTAPNQSGAIKKGKLIIPTPVRFVEDMGVNDVIMNWDFICSCGHVIPGNSEKCPDCGVGFDWTKVNPLVLVKDSPEQMQRDLLN